MGFRFAVLARQPYDAADGDQQEKSRRADGQDTLLEEQREVSILPAALHSRAELIVLPRCTRALWNMDSHYGDTTLGTSSRELETRNAKMAVCHERYS